MIVSCDYLKKISTIHGCELDVCSVEQKTKSLISGTDNCGYVKVIYSVRMTESLHVRSRLLIACKDSRGLEQGVTHDMCTMRLSNGH